MKWRFRTNWLNQLILQVGRRVPDLSGIPGDTYIKWEDATTEDLANYYKDHGVTV